MKSWHFGDTLFLCDISLHFIFLVYLLFACHNDFWSPLDVKYYSNMKDIGLIWCNDKNTALFCKYLLKYNLLVCTSLSWRSFVDAGVFVLVCVTVSYPEEVDVIVETLQGIFTRGSLQQHYELTLTTLRPGAPPVRLPQPKYGHTQMDPPPSFEPLQAQRVMI